MLIINAKIHTMDNLIINHGYILFNEKIISFGDMNNLPTVKDTILDAKGAFLYPGFIDVHTHLGMIEDSLGNEGDDVNEDSEPITPHMSPIDCINPLDPYFDEAIKNGITTVVATPGSANPIAGQLVIIKTLGRRIDSMIIKAPFAIKFSLGENPKGVYGERNQSPVTRMGAAALIRDTLKRAHNYMLDKSDIDTLPDFDAKLEALEGLFTGELQAHFHAHRTDDIFTAIRISKEFNLNYVIVHGSEAHMIADILLDEQTKIITGPFMTDRSKPELKNLTDKAPAILSDAGLMVAISTDHPETPIKHLLTAITVAVKAGMSEYNAFASITSSAAKIIGIDDYCGSIKPGLCSNFVLFNNNPLDYKSKITHVFIDGENINL